MAIDVTALADELEAACSRKQILPAPISAREPGFDLTTAYAVEAELTRRRRASGVTTVGRKVGYANKAMWRLLKLETLVWAHMYSDTVHYAEGTRTDVAVGNLCSPKIEPEIVFALRDPIDTENADPAAVLASVEWLALGFEIVDCVFADWKLQPSDFVAAYGLHAALVVGTPRRIDASLIATLVDQLPRFRVQLSRNSDCVAEGSGRNSLRSPALCLGELGRAIASRSGQEPLLAGELVSTGSLTEPQAILPGETWTASVDGIDLPELAIATVP